MNVLPDLVQEKVVTIWICLVAAARHTCERPLAETQICTYTFSHVCTLNLTFFMCSYHTHKQAFFFSCETFLPTLNNYKLNENFSIQEYWTWYLSICAQIYIYDKLQASTINRVSACFHLQPGVWSMMLFDWRHNNWQSDTCQLLPALFSCSYISDL